MKIWCGNKPYNLKFLIQLRLPNLTFSFQSLTHYISTCKFGVLSDLFFNEIKPPPHTQ